MYKTLKADLTQDLISNKQGKEIKFRKSVN